MPRRPPRGPAIGLGAGPVVLLVVVVLGVRSWRAPTPRPRQRDLARARLTERLAWTDWDGVRRELDAGVGADSSAEEVDAFLVEAFAADLSSTSALVESARRCSRSSASPPRPSLGAARPVGPEVPSRCSVRRRRRPRRRGGPPRRWAGPRPTRTTASGSAGPTCWPGSGPT